MKRYKCQYPRCKKPADFHATNGSAEWMHVCAEHQPYTWYPDAWEPIKPAPSQPSNHAAKA